LLANSASTPPHPALGEAIRSLRLKAGLTQENLSEASGIHTTEISRLENGRRNPTLNTFKRLGKGLSVPYSYIVGLEEKLDLKRGEPA
jgi:transcriptional regulator with XRE-family HTH domain